MLKHIPLAPLKNDGIAAALSVKKLNVEHVFCFESRAFPVNAKCIKHLH